MDGGAGAASVSDMKWLVFPILLAGLAPGAVVDDFIAKAKANDGEAGGKAAEFLVAGMPEKDKETLTEEFLTTNLDLAFQAREEFPWAKPVPEDIFHNDVLPYAVLDETREAWRKACFS